MAVSVSLPSSHSLVLPMLRFRSLFASLLVGLILPLCAFAQSPQDTLPLMFPLLTPNIIDRPSDGQIFFTALGGPGGSYAEITNDSGVPVYYKQSQLPFADFKQHPDGSLSYYDPQYNGFVLSDHKNNFIKAVTPVGDYTIDSHDIKLLPNGHCLILAYDVIPDYDVSSIVGEPRQVSVLGVIIQELDNAGNLVFQWRGFDEGRFVPEDMEHFETITNEQMDATHSNSIDVDEDGNLLLSSRNMSEITKINRTTGDIMWRFGGKHNQFTIIGDSLNGFSYQHSAISLSRDRILLFDNGVYHPTQFSRAVEYQLDLEKKTATLVWQFQHNRTVYSPIMGNAQRLENGNTFIGWGGANFPAPGVTEVRPNGSIAFEGTFPPGSISYRAYRFKWLPTSSVSEAKTSEVAITVYPNPTTEKALVAIDPQIAASATIQVFDVNGKLVSNGQHVLDTRNWASGVYRVQVQTPTRTTSRSLVVAH
jgi:hypothetical protein